MVSELKTLSTSKQEEDTLENNFLRYLHNKQTQFKWVEDYPAHLHIDILPLAQKKDMEVN